MSCDPSSSLQQLLHSDKNSNLPCVTDISVGSLTDSNDSYSQEDNDDSVEQEFEKHSLDVYADVRDRMEHLSAQDKAMYATHTSEKEATAKSHTECSNLTVFSSILAFTILTITGRVRDLFSALFGRGRYNHRESGFACDDEELYAKLLNGWDNFFCRRVYHRIQDTFNRPVASNPGARIDVLERVSADGNKTMEILGSLDNLDSAAQKTEYQKNDHVVNLPGGRTARRCLNLGSYNYLGFADNWDTTCRENVMESLEKFGIGASSAPLDFGTTSLHKELEKTVAEFLGKEDALALTMGFNTNQTTIPALVGRGDLIISDELNHKSIVNGVRASGAAIRTFRHNSSSHLEELMREAIIMGRHRTRQPWGKILVILEGVYSMEGEYCDLRRIVEVCKKYGAFVYLDEAHSIGAVGPTGRGVSEYTGVDTSDIDIMMGTFTKSFGGMGGYIAASKEIVDILRRKCSGSSCHNSLSPVVCQQVITSFNVIMGRDGTDIGKQKINTLRDNSNYMRMKLSEMGLLVLGNYDSPILPVMIYNNSKIAAFSRECMKRGLAVVVVGFPAVPLLLARARFCISAGHSRKELDSALQQIEEIANNIGIKFGVAE